MLREPPDADAHQLLASLLDGVYPKPFVVDDGAVRRLHFSFADVQSMMGINDPYALSVAYTRKMMAFLLFLPQPKHVVIVGLGGGSLTKFCYRQLPDVRITTVEINQDVIALAGLFNVPTPDERLSILHADATDYFATTADFADVILVDGFDKHGIAAAFCHARFYRNLRARLRPGGMLVMNLVGSRYVRHTHVRLIAETFMDRLIVQEVSVDENHLVFAFNDSGFSPDWNRIERTAKPLAQQYGLDFPVFADKLQRNHRRQTRRWC